MKNKIKELIKNVFLLIMLIPGIMLVIITPIYILFLMSEVYERDFNIFHAWMIISYVFLIIFLSRIKNARSKRN